MNTALPDLDTQSVETIIAQALDLDTDQAALIAAAPAPASELPEMPTCQTRAQLEHDQALLKFRGDYQTGPFRAAAKQAIHAIHARHHCGDDMPATAYQEHTNAWRTAFPAFDGMDGIPIDDAIKELVDLAFDETVIDLREGGAVAGPGVMLHEVDPFADDWDIYIEDGERQSRHELSGVGVDTSGMFDLDDASEDELDDIAAAIAAELEQDWEPSTVVLSTEQYETMRASLESDTWPDGAYLDDGAPHAIVHPSMRAVDWDDLLPPAEDDSKPVWPWVLAVIVGALLVAADPGSPIGWIVAAVGGGFLAVMVGASLRGES